MLEVQESLEEEVTAEPFQMKGSSNTGHQSEHLTLNSQCMGTVEHSQQHVVLSPSVISSETTPSNEETGLLSLPWEMVARIVSHLPAQCVITVLPQVCRALRNIGVDNTAWQLRARRLIGSRAAFPLGPPDSFNWPIACLEMEQLISCWAGPRVATFAHEGEGPVQAEGQYRAPDVNREEGGMVEQGEVGLNNKELPEAQQQAEQRGASFEEREGAGDNDAVEEMEEERIDRVIAEMGENYGERSLREREEGTDATGSPSGLEHFCLPSGHIAEVNCVLLVGGQGALCASGSRDRNVNLWDVQKGALVHTLGGGPGLFSTHRGWVWCLASCGPLLCSGSFDSTVRLWDLNAGACERGVIQGRAAVLCLSCQAHILMAGSYDRKVSIYDTRAPEPLVKSLRLHANAVLCLAADEKYILSGSKDGTLVMFDRRAEKLLHKVQLSSYLLSMSYSGQEVWAGDNRGMLHAFSLQGGSIQPLSQFDVGHRSLVTGVHYSPGALYTCSSDRTIQVHLPSAPPKTLCTLHRSSGINGLSVEGGVLAVASGNICVEVWRPAHL